MDYTVFDILSRLSKEQLSQFRKFVHSPYYNESKKLTAFFDKLYDRHPDYPVDKEILFSLIDGNNKFNNSTVVNLLHDLQCLAESFVTVSAFENNLPLSASNITRVIRKNGQHRVLGKIIKRFDEAGHMQGTAELFSVLDFQDEKFNLMAESGRFVGKKMFDELEKLVIRRNALNKMYFCIEFVKTWHIYSNIKKKFTSNDNEYSDDEHEIESMLLSLPYENSISDYRELILIYIDLHNFQKGSMDYFLMKSNLEKVIDKLHQDEKNYLFGRLIDYTTVQARVNDEYISEQKKLYGELLEKEYYKSSVCDYLPPDLWRIVILHGYRQNDPVWLQTITDKYSQKLNPKQKKNLEIYARAFIMYCQKEYHRVLELVHRVEFDLKAFKVDIKSLMLRSYYETKQFEAAISLIDSFQHILSSGNLEVQQKKNYRSYVRAVGKMINYRMNPSLKNLKKAETAFASKGNIPNKEWLAEKLSEIK
jgi:hypothetical protein